MSYFADIIADSRRAPRGPRRAEPAPLQMAQEAPALLASTPMPAAQTTASPHTAEPPAAAPPMAPHVASTDTIIERTVFAPAQGLPQVAEIPGASDGGSAPAARRSDPTGSADGAQPVHPKRSYDANATAGLPPRRPARPSAPGLGNGSESMIARRADAPKDGEPAGRTRQEFDRPYQPATGSRRHLSRETDHVSARTATAPAAAASPGLPAGATEPERERSHDTAMQVREATAPRAVAPAAVVAPPSRKYRWDAARPSLPDASPAPARSEPRVHIGRMQVVVLGPQEDPARTSSAGQRQNVEERLDRQLLRNL